MVCKVGEVVNEIWFIGIFKLVYKLCFLVIVKNVYLLIINIFSYGVVIFNMKIRRLIVISI